MTKITTAEKGVIMTLMADSGETVKVVRSLKHFKCNEHNKTAKIEGLFLSIGRKIYPVFHCNLCGDYFIDRVSYELHTAISGALW